MRILDGFRSFAWPRRTVTVSIGAAEACANDSAVELIQRADSALYSAKLAGRDQAVVAAAAVPAPPPPAQQETWHTI